MKDLAAKQDTMPAAHAADQTVSVLALEDSAGDALLLREELQASLGTSANIVTVGSIAEGLSCLRERSFDIALMDLDLPDSSGQDINLLSEAAPEMPLLIFTGKRDEARLLSLVREGAHDVLIKRDTQGGHLSRTIRVAIERSRRAARDDLALRRLLRSESDLRAIVERSSVATMVVDTGGRILYANPATVALFGRDMADLQSLPFGYPLLTGPSTDVDIALVDGVSRIAEMRVVDILWHGHSALHVTLQDVTERRRLLAEAQQQARDSERTAEALAQSNFRLMRAGEVLRRRAHEDALTGLSNRRHVDAELPRMLAEARARGEHLVLAFADLDEFKAINDRYGHQAGDQVLQHFAQMARSRFRAGDLVARLGGEEFAFAITGVTMADAWLACERFRHAVEQQQWPGLPAHQRITVCFGLSDSGHAPDAAALLAAADAQLYRAKAGGRNRIEPAEPDRTLRPGGPQHDEARE